MSHVPNIAEMLVQVPAFARIDEYAGLWLIEPNAAASLWRMAASIDLRKHVADGAEPIKASIEKTSANGQTIAVIRAAGTLMKQQSSMGGTSTIQMRKDIRSAVADPDVAAILLAIDSPGGTVAGTADLAADVKAASRVKPVWAQVEDLGASAAYWLASQTDRITANAATALVGSIGTVQVMYDMSAAAEKEGVRTLVFKTGPLKGMGAPGAPVTQEQQDHVQALIDQVQLSFDKAVRDGRNLSAKELAAVRHGGVLTAPAALDARLIDAIQPAGKTLNDLAAFVKGGAKQPSGAGRSGAVLPMAARTLPTRRV
jgi:signal peptide peptidase SppA